MTTIANLHSLFLECSSVSTDTRKIEKNSLFVALKGDNFDANTFAGIKKPRPHARLLRGRCAYAAEKR